MSCEVTTSSDPAAGSGTSGESGAKSASKAQEKCLYKGKEISCKGPGRWSSSKECWVLLIDPQPAPDHPLWEGHLTPEGDTTGQIYHCLPPGAAFSAGQGSGYYYWRDSAPPDVDPAALAHEAVDRMKLVAPNVGATPLPHPNAKSVIGLPTWLWIAGADQHSWGPITATASSGGQTVTATAQVQRVVWDMGDGNTVTCATTGTEWRSGMGAQDSPTCGYRYTHPGHVTITATTHWNVHWSGAGQGGIITFDLTGTRDLTVVELHTVVTG